MPEQKTQANIYKEQARELLKLHYGFDDFRKGQERAIEAIFSGKNTVVIMPTGGGKSLIYQLPALVLSGVTIVVSPLISLMKDQVDSLQRIGIPAIFINSAISPAETLKRLEEVRNGRVKILYIAPERFYSLDFMKMLQSVTVSLFAIDEAHCISQWGHDFRPSYMRLKNAIAALGNPIVVALTATATPEVKKDIVRQLELKDPAMIVTGFARPNLRFAVRRANEGQKADQIIDIVNSFRGQSGVIYVGTRSRADQILQHLLDNDIEAAAYHAGMDAEDRQWTQEKFMKGDAKVIVATNAFGLGIDKSDIRFVIHFDMPGTIEAYYQEAGRAGRDGRESQCVLFYNSRDRYLHEFFIKGDNPPVEIIREIYDVLLNYGTETILLTYSELGKMLSDSVPEMAVGTSLRILEKMELISRPNEKKGSAFVKLIKSAEEIVEAFGKRAKKQKDLFAGLIEKYNKELSEGWQVNLEEVAELLGEKKDTIVRLFKKLAEGGAVEYQPPFKGTEVRILKRVDSGELDIDSAEMRDKMRRAYKKLDAMEEYVFEMGCRQKFILNYFGDDDFGVCGKCDICLHQSDHNERVSEARRTDPGYAAPSKFKNEDSVEPPKKKSSLSTKLTQLETFDLFKKGLSVKAIAVERGMTEVEVEEHLKFLKRMGLV